MKRVFFFLAFIFPLNLLHATEWKRALHVSPHQGHQIFELHNALYRIGQIEGNTELFRSSNGVDWTSLPVHNIPNQLSGHVVAASEHGVCIAAARHISSVDRKQYIHCSPDALTWTQIYSSSLTVDMNTFGDLAFHQGRLYAARLDGSVMKSGNDILSSSWTTLPRHEYLPPWNRSRFFTFKGIFHVSLTQRSHSATPRPITYIHRFDADGNLESSPVSTIDWGLENVALLGPNTQQWLFAEHDGKLYMGHAGLWSTEGDTLPYVWDKNSPFAFGQAMPLPVLERLFVWNSGGQIMELNFKGQWSQAERTSGGLITETVKTLTIGSKAITGMADSIWILDWGLTALTGSFVNQTTLFSSHKGGNVLRFTVAANAWEEVSFAVKNLGDAISKRDIQRMYLVRILGTEQSETVAEFVADSNDPSRWILNSHAKIEHGDDLFITVDVADQATDGVTVILSIDPGSFSVVHNSTYTLSNPIIGPPFTIKKVAAQAGAGEIAEVVIAPQPARNRVQFLYDLASPSDISVKIFDRQGALISDINDANKPAGARAATTWDASKNAAGVYYATIKISGNDGTEKLIKRKVIVER